jgi:hypothetical protein
MRRNRIGTKSTELWAWDIEDLSNMQGPLVVQEYIQLLIRKPGVMQATIPPR